MVWTAGGTPCKSVKVLAQRTAAHRLSGLAIGAGDQLDVDRHLDAGTDLLIRRTRRRGDRTAPPNGRNSSLELCSIRWFISLQHAVLSTLGSTYWIGGATGAHEPKKLPTISTAIIQVI